MVKNYDVWPFYVAILNHNEITDAEIIVDTRNIVKSRNYYKVYHF